MTGARRRVGLLGGSFNPAHAGHRKISLFALEALELDEIWWLVSPGNPLKPKAGMASLAARVSSASKQARRAPIRVTVIEREFRTRYTVDTLGAIKRRYTKFDFVWLMGSDNLAQFHRWKNWRGIARRMPIAVIARPGYESAALTSPAMAWLRRYQVPASRIAAFTTYEPPALAVLRFDPDTRSATAIRAETPDWADAYADVMPRDQVTRRLITDRRK